MTDQGYAVLFGGYIVIINKNLFQGDGYTNDIYYLDLVNERWGKPVINGRLPQPRESFGMLFVI